MQFLNILRARVAARRRGFTLIELLIVIVIIGILAVGFAPTVLNAPKKARDAVRKGNIASVKQAVETYAVDNNSKYPQPGGALLCIDTSAAGIAIAPYFQGSSLPKDPSSSRSAWSGGPACVIANSVVGSGIAYKGLSDTSYALVTQLEVAGTGNLATADATDAKIGNATLTNNAGDYYAIIVK